MEIMRECKECKTEYPLIEFVNKSSNETGRICRVCKNKKANERYKRKMQDPEFRKLCVERSLNNRKNQTPDKKLKSSIRQKELSNDPAKKQRMKEYRLKNKEKLSQYGKDYYQKRKESGTVTFSNNSTVMTNWRIANADRLKQYSKDYYDKNKDIIKIKKKQYRREHRDLIKAYNKSWRMENPDKNRELSARRRARKKHATPKWLTEKDYDNIRAFYTEAQRLSIETGIEYAVDHIHPLSGEYVCGLHVPWNLQILTKSENSSKGNRINLPPDLT
jgi:hypothetical protein